MTLKLINTYTDEEITVENVTAYEIREGDGTRPHTNGTRVYTNENGRYNMTTYACYYPPTTIDDAWRGLF